MPNEIDPYSEWLGIQSPERPLSHYRLLGLDEFESDPQTITVAADRAIALVRKVRPGAQAESWQKLLDELSLAKMCLSDPGRKGQYDAQLRTRTPNRPAPAAAAYFELASPNPDLFPPTHRAIRVPAASDVASPAGTTSSSSGYTPPAAGTYSAPIAADPAPMAQPFSGGAYSPPTADPAPIQTGYAPQQPGYGLQSPAYPQQPGYAPQQPQYGQAGYGQDYGQPVYGTPQPGYGTAQPAYGASQPAYGNPQQPYPAQQAYANAYPPGYQVPNQAMPGYGQATPVYGQGYAAPSAAQPYGAAAQPTYSAAQPNYGAGQFGTTPYASPQANPGYQPYAPTSAPVKPAPVAPVAPDLQAFESMPSIESLLSGGMNFDTTPSYSPPSYSTPKPATEVAASEPRSAISIPASPAPASPAVAKKEAPVASNIKSISSGTTVFRPIPPITRPEVEPLPPPGSAATTARPVSVTEERQKQNMAIVGVLSGAAVLLVVMFLIVLSRRGKNTASEVDPQLAAMAAKLKERERELANLPVKPAEPPNPVAIQDNPPVRPQVKAQPPKPTEPKPEPTPQVAVVEPERMKPVQVQPEPVKPQPQPEPATPEPKPEPPVTPPPITPPAAQPAADPGQAVAFQRALNSARKAMGDRDFAKSEADLKKAQGLAATPEQTVLLEKYETLNKYVLEFWAAVTKALEGLQATDEITIGSTRAIVVNVSRDELSIKVGGTIHSFTKQNMKAGVANAVANMWFDQANPTTKVFLGAFQAVDPNGDIEMARRLWKDASLAGASVEDLIPLLDVDVNAVTIVQGPVPDDNAIDKAEKDLEAKYAAELKGAINTQKRRSLADKLLQAAQDTSSPAERYVCFHRAVELAVDTGSAVAIVQTIDEMAKWFTIDPLAMKADALALASKDNTNSINAKAITREALEAGDAALTASQSTIAKSLSATASESATVARDPELVRQAKALEDKVKLLP